MARAFEEERSARQHLEELVKRNEDEVADQRDLIQKSLGPMQKSRRDIEEGLEEIAELSTEVKDGMARLSQEDDRVSQVCTLSCRSSGPPAQCGSLCRCVALTH